ncbi:hypothetical protein HPL003_21805 [Paenibacillus terrae HPL-003]|uniref:Uncharacterized protein n=1 Tax=Paenibacillus terrae (strain HPL-003) TaxID=985665 RepID=G7VQ20_PAETH|nr:hypothetical protein [Paenibacillus terrae]AET61089.1 hypothetical protein HPL003_21805 [Paenibacillus terrae HPL-003]
MTWLNVAGTTFAIALIVWAEWRCLVDNQKKERASLIAVTGIAWLMAVLILIFPDIPGPIVMFNSIFKPLISGLK